MYRRIYICERGWGKSTPGLPARQFTHSGKRVGSQSSWPEVVRPSTKSATPSPRVHPVFSFSIAIPTAPLRSSLPPPRVVVVVVVPAKPTLATVYHTRLSTLLFLRASLIPAQLPTTAQQPRRAARRSSSVQRDHKRNPEIKALN